MCHISGALAQADVLGIFGREGLDMAALWGPPAITEPGAFAFRLYRDYDGTGQSFGQASVRASSADPDRLALYAALRSEDGALTLMVVNKSGQDLTSTVALSGFTAAGSASVYRYSDQRLDAIVHEPSLIVGPGGFTTLFPANSITLVAVPPAGWPTWQVYLPVVGENAAAATPRHRR